MMSEKLTDNTDKKEEITMPLPQGEALLAFYALRAQEADDEHHDGCPCCLPR